MSTTTSLHSNAFNFMSFLSSGVDPRTGLYTASISLPELKANDLAGPFVPITLAFSPLNTRDSGYGFGWNLQLSQYDPVTRMLSLSSGESFKVTHTSVGGDRLLMKEQKLDSFHVHDTGGDTFRIVHKSGLVERLRVGGSADNRLALPYEISSPDGRAVYLAYDYFNGQQILASVSDSQRILLRMTRENRRVEITLNPDLFPTRFSMELAEDDFRVAKVVLPTKDAACWRFRYERLNGLLCIIDAWTPSGAHETARYDDAGHLFPGTLARPALRRVTEHVSDPGQGQPPIRTRYGYRAHNTVNTHNFLGNNAAGLIWEDNGEDNLYRIRGDYQYGTTESLIVGNQVVRTVERSFNRFHLLTEETTTQGDNVKKTRTVYHALEQTDFDQQPPYFQLPKTVTTGWSLRSNASQVRYETVSSDYDNFGNLTRQVQPSGVVETSTWYPAEGETQGEFQCPPDPQDFVRQVRTRTVTPAPSTYGEAAPVLRTRFVYDAMAPVSGASQPWLVLTRETLLRVQGDSETTLHTTGHLYIQQPEDALTHGRPLLDTFTLNGISTLTSFAYSKSLSRAVKKGKQAETVLKTTQTLSSTLDSHTRTINLEHSLLNGEPLLTLDDAKVEIRYTYDALERITSETVAPDTSYEATRHYAYGLVAADGQMAHQDVTDVKGVTTRSELDGLGRVFRETRQNTEGDGLMRDTYAATYDARGQLQTETRYDWLDEKQKTLTLTSTYGYDDWGQQVSETRPDGVVTCSLMNPFGWRTEDGDYMPTQSSWQQTGPDSSKHYGWVESQLNLLGKPDKVERFALDKTSMGKQIFRYDGLGRLVEEVSTLGHVGQYSYDAFDRMVESTLPNKDKVLRSYAAHSPAELASEITVQSANARLAAVIAGEQLFDGLGRLIQLRTGGRVENYRYDSSHLRISERITPSNASIHYTYDLGLTEEPIRTQSPDDDVSFEYDEKSARMLKSINGQGERSYTYDAAGHLQQNIWKANGHTWTTQYTHSLHGRQLQRTDVSSLSTVYSHDNFGRVSGVTQGKLQAVFTYDSLSRTAGIILTTDLMSGAHLDTAIEYDEHSREILRTLSQNGHPARTIHQAWRADDQLLSRHLQEAGKSLLFEEFTYDNRGRLILFECSGATLPRNRQGHEIISQLFRFDALDNIIASITTFADGSREMTGYRYNSPVDACQLLEVTYRLMKGTQAFPDYLPSVSFAYDKDGNMLNDEQGQQLIYDSQNRLMSVRNGSGLSVNQFAYDGHNHLTAVTQGSDDATLRFYEGDRLSNTVQGQTRTQYLSDGDTPLGQQQVGDSASTALLLMSNASNSVIGEIQQSELRTAVYNAYGERSSDDELQSLLAFNGEIRDPSCGWYLLGKGYRAYNPELMRFHSPDSMSPFGAGGLNPYGYCIGNPIAFQDPTGHSVGQLYYNQHETNTLALGITWGAAALGIAFSAASFGALSPVMMAVVGVGIATDIASAGLITAGLTNKDPEQADKLMQYGYLLGMANSAIGFWGAGKSALRSASKKLANGGIDIGTQTTPSLGGISAATSRNSLDDIDLQLFDPKKTTPPRSPSSSSSSSSSSLASGSRTRKSSIADAPSSSSSSTTTNRSDSVSSVESERINRSSTSSSESRTATPDTPLAPSKRAYQYAASRAIPGHPTISYSTEVIRKQTL
ncbi:YD repeat-containing protein [Pseudomonas syringae pv. helianthi]|uniref:YD repeat-containing protein n=1 Tax=Pseudomonas syringae pv. helianthi TaxID=251654 RepID=A0A3M6CMM9_9PSED|nr:RHS repeat-associated core domain-containing protein [Pseudomonas syringae group genomosp. 7]RMV45037.1 YD repeat-containing protein [Pseudomonas syringae pv. helianthi]